MQINWRNGSSALNEITVAQAIAICKIQQRFSLPESIIIDKEVCGTCIFVNLSDYDCGKMVIGIEVDGYTHT